MPYLDIGWAGGRYNWISGIFTSTVGNSFANGNSGDQGGSPHI